jgi:hypothetical protein
VPARFVNTDESQLLRSNALYRQNTVDGEHPAPERAVGEGNARVVERQCLGPGRHRVRPIGELVMVRMLLVLMLGSVGGA